MNRAALLYTWMCLGIVTYACGDTRKLELFEKAPKPEPDSPEVIPPSTCAPTEPSCMMQPIGECDDDTDCTGPNHACVDSRCVECRADEHCPMKRVCNTGILRCTEPCSAPEECKEKDRSVCDVARGFCVQCSSDVTCGKNDVCDIAQGMCVGCNNDLDCGDAGVCDTARQECTPVP